MQAQRRLLSRLAGHAGPLLGGPSADEHLFLLIFAFARHGLSQSLVPSSIRQNQRICFAHSHAPMKTG